jgi:hypothetical protein
MSPPSSGSKNKSGRKPASKTVSLPKFRIGYEKEGSGRQLFTSRRLAQHSLYLKTGKIKYKLVNVSDIEFQQILWKGL